MDNLLSTPVDIGALKKNKKSVEMLADGVFTNLLYYAKRHWTYTASGNTGGEQLLAGTATSAPCGGIATALKLALTKGLGLSESSVEYIRVTGYVWTDRSYLCWDKNVIGNLRMSSDRNYRNGCIFNEHYYLKCNDKYYDPCLGTSYATRDQSIRMRFTGKQSVLVGTNRRMLITSDRKHLILYMPQEKVPGFRGSWCMLPATKKEVQKLLGKRDYEKEMAALKGASQFARLMKELR